MLGGGLCGRRICYLLAAALPLLRMALCSLCGSVLFPHVSSTHASTHPTTHRTPLRPAGFDYCFDVNFSADLTIMEEASELLKRLRKSWGLELPVAQGEHAWRAGVLERGCVRALHLQRA